MFRGRAANPCANKFLFMKEMEEHKRKHKARIRSMKPAIDNRPPKKPSHLVNNRKKEQLLEDQFLKIERENKILLEKMSYIMTKKSLDNQNDLTHRPIKSLNKTHRKQELQRITRENQRLLRRIQEREPFYDHNKWEEDRKKNEKLVKNISEYPTLSMSKPGKRKVMRKAQSNSRIVTYIPK